MPALRQASRVRRGSYDSSLPVDAARIPGDRHRQQCGQNGRDYPGGLYPVPGRHGHAQVSGDMMARA
jgi:hypothetical protein